MLVGGKWSGDWHPVQKQDEKGGFVRQTSSFRNWVTPDGTPGPTGEGGFPAEAGRYRLYAALICPWASRTLAGRALKGLEAAIPVSLVEPAMSDQGWRFGGDGEPELGARYLHQIYTAADPVHTGRATVPVLWDRQRKTIVNNESADILRMLDSGFGPLATGAVTLYPPALAAEMETFDQWLYDGLNNGVYRAGFATRQEAYEEAARGVFATLDALEERLGRSDGPYLFGDALTGSDVRLFVTLIRFDAAYHGLFKCNLKRLADYPNVSAYLDRLLAVPAIAGTVDLEHIKRGYYSIKALNPTGIVPIGPLLPFPERAVALR